MVQSSLLKALRDLPKENQNLLKEQSLASSKGSGQVEVRLVINEDVIIRSFPLEDGHLSLAQIEEQTSVIFSPYLPRNRAIKLRVFFVDEQMAEHVLDTDETLQSLLNAQQSSENKSVSVRLEFLQDDVNLDKKFNVAKKPEELDEFECSICDELGTRELFVKCLHCNFSHVCCNCQLTMNQHENHLTVPYTFFYVPSKNERTSEMCKEEVQLDATSL